MTRTKQRSIVDGRAILRAYKRDATRFGCECAAIVQDEEAVEAEPFTLEASPVQQQLIAMPINHKPDPIIVDKRQAGLFE